MMTVQDRATSSVNDTGTNGKIDTPLTQVCSADVPGIIEALIAMRVQFGATSPKGHRCSNLIEQLGNLPPGPEARIEYLTPDWVKDQRAHLIKSIERSMTDLCGGIQ